MARDSGAVCVCVSSCPTRYSWDRDTTTRLNDDVWLANATSAQVDAEFIGEYPCYEGIHFLFAVVGVVVAVPVVLLALRLAPHSGDIAQVDIWFDPYFVLAPAERTFLGPFTRSRRTAPKIDVRGAPRQPRLPR